MSIEPMTSERTTLPLLADPSTYVACRWNLSEEPEKRAYWLGLFRGHLPSLLDEAVREAVERGGEEASVRRRAERVAEGFYAFLDALAEEPWLLGEPATILHLCWERERLLREQGFDDPYRLAKHRENETALALLPEVLAELDAMPAAERDEAVVKGVFAGNIFDLGATQTVERFQNEGVDFRAILGELKGRPWLVDDLDAWLERMQGPAHRQALLFVDNAGPDVVLGMLGLTRYLLGRGTDVILTANSSPALNDVTHGELVELVEQASRLDAVLSEAWQGGRLRLLANGNDAPLIDMTRLNPDFVEAIGREPVDLLVIEGMGRAIESNLEARFTCETLKVAMIKDQGVADAMGGELYDLMFKYEPGA